MTKIGCNMEKSCYMHIKASKKCQMISNRSLASFYTKGKPSWFVVSFLPYSSKLIDLKALCIAEGIVRSLIPNSCRCCLCLIHCIIWEGNSQLNHLKGCHPQQTKVTSTLVKNIQAFCEAEVFTILFLFLCTFLCQIAEACYMKKKQDTLHTLDLNLKRVLWFF